MTATPPILIWKILPPKTPCSRTVGPAHHWNRNMAARCDWWCRICISGRARSGYRASNFLSATRRATGKSAAITTAAIPGKKSAIPVTELEAAVPCFTSPQWGEVELRSNSGEGYGRSRERNPSPGASRRPLPKGEVKDHHHLGENAHAY